MKLSPIQRVDLLKAADDLDAGVESLWSEYWVWIPERKKEYPFKQLIRKAYTNATGIAIGADFFQSNDGYRQYIEKTFQYPIFFKVRDNIPFFTDSDLALLSQYAGKSYDSTNDQDKLVGEQLRKTIFAKTNTWARALNLDGFEIKMDNSWQRSGYFARYSWARIYRKGDGNKKIFFTVGVSGEDEVLFYKLDCHYRSFDPDNTLSPAQVEVFNRIVKPTGANWQEISVDELSGNNWESLIQITHDFIEHYLPLYDEVINAVWNFPITSKPSTSLREQPVPKGIGQLPTRSKPSGFSASPNYDGENKKRQQLGEKGEALVMAYEKDFLIAQGRADLAATICKVPDFEGYDILSFHSDGKQKFIEVKTTTGTFERPFFWTLNEKATMLRHPDNYFLYRLYNYDETADCADFYKLSGDITDRILEEAIQYRVFIK